VPQDHLFPVFTIEKHHGIDRSGIADFEDNGELDSTGGTNVKLKAANPENPYTPHGKHIKKWLDAYRDREQKLFNEGLITLSANELIDKLHVRKEFDKDLSAVTRDTSGTLLDLSSAAIHTSTWTVTFTETTLKDSFEITNEAWIVTAYTPDGLYTFLLVS